MGIQQPEWRHTTEFNITYERCKHLACKQNCSKAAASFHEPSYPEITDIDPTAQNSYTWVGR